MENNKHSKIIELALRICNHNLATKNPVCEAKSINCINYIIMYKQAQRGTVNLIVIMSEHLTGDSGCSFKVTFNILINLSLNNIWLWQLYNRTELSVRQNPVLTITGTNF